MLRQKARDVSHILPLWEVTIQNKEIDMFHSIHPLPFVAILAVAMGLPRGAAAGGSAPVGANGCPPRTDCDHALGVALIPQTGWQLVPSGHWPPHVLAWFAQPPLGLDHNVRLLIGPGGTTNDPHDARAAAAAAQKLIAGYRGHVHTSHYTVRYGGAPGVLIRGLPGGPALFAIIILAHQGVLYSIIAPGATLAPDQQQALASLQFIPRAGPFPLANPPTRQSPPVHGTVPRGMFSGATLTLTRHNGLRGGEHTYSWWFQARNHLEWKVSYSVPCSGGQSRLVVDIRNSAGRVVDRVLHRSGRAAGVTQTEWIGGLVRLDVQSPCSGWSVTAYSIRAHMPVPKLTQLPGSIVLSSACRMQSSLQTRAALRTPSRDMWRHER